MKAAWIVLLAELYRLRCSRGARWSALALVLVGGVRVLVEQVSDTAARMNADGALHGLATGGGGWAPFVDGWRAALSAATLFLLIHAARAVAWDRESGVLRLALVRASSRGAAVLGRALMALPLVALAFGASGLGALGATFFFHGLEGFGPLVEDGYELMSQRELLHELATAALACLTPLVATYSLGILVSSLAHRASTAVTAALAIFLSFDLFKEALGASRYLVFASFAPSFIDGSALAEMSGVARGFSDAGFSDDLFLRSIWLPVPQASGLVLLAMWIAYRRPA